MRRMARRVAISGITRLKCRLLMCLICHWTFRAPPCVFAFVCCLGARHTTTTLACKYVLRICEPWTEAILVVDAVHAIPVRMTYSLWWMKGFLQNKVHADGGIPRVLVFPADADLTLHRAQEVNDRVKPHSCTLEV